MPVIHPLVEQCAGLGLIARTTAAGHVVFDILTTFMFWQDVVNRRGGFVQLLIAIGTFPLPGFKNVLSELSTGKLWTEDNEIG